MGMVKIIYMHPGLHGHIRVVMFSAEVNEVPAVRTTLSWCSTRLQVLCITSLATNF